MQYTYLMNSHSRPIIKYQNPSTFRYYGHVDRSNEILKDSKKFVLSARMYTIIIYIKEAWIKLQVFQYVFILVKTENKINPRYCKPLVTPCMNLEKNILLNLEYVIFTLCDAKEGNMFISQYMCVPMWLVGAC